jgi:hypothetical protein
MKRRQGCGEVASSVATAGAIRNNEAPTPARRRRRRASGNGPARCRCWRGPGRRGRRRRRRWRGWRSAGCRRPRPTCPRRPVSLNTMEAGGQMSKYTHTGRRYDPPDVTRVARSRRPVSLSTTKVGWWMGRLGQTIGRARLLGQHPHKARSDPTLRKRVGFGGRSRACSGSALILQVGWGRAPITVGPNTDFVQPEALGVGVAPGGRHEHLRRKA